MRRRLCTCGHKHDDHARGGTRCLAWVDDGNSTALVMCSCQGYVQRPARKRAAAAIDRALEGLV